ncbi:MAG: CoA transferase [Alphaproteobacteria bacterium]
MTLAQLGADVIRFDPIQGGLDSRRWPVSPEGRSLYWVGLNKGKRSLAIDTSKPEGQEIATNLITAPGPDQGIFVTNFPAGGWFKYETLKKKRDDLIMVNLIGSSDGTSAVDYTINCAVGFPFVTGPTHGGAAVNPVNHVMPAWDAICGINVALSVLAAERHRSRTGQGQLVKMALSDIAFSMVGNLGYIAEVMINKEDRRSYGNYLYGLTVDDVLFLLDAQQVVLVETIADGHEHQIPGAAGFLRHIDDLAITDGRATNGQRREELDARPGEHPAGQHDRRQEAATLRMAIRPHLGHGGAGQEVQPLPQRRQGIAGLEGGGGVVQQGGHGLHRREIDVVFTPLGGTDPVGVVGFLFLGHGCHLLRPARWGRRQSCCRASGRSHRRSCRERYSGSRRCSPPEAEPASVPPWAGHRNRAASPEPAACQCPAAPVRRTSGWRWSTSGPRVPSG